MREVEYTMEEYYSGGKRWAVYEPNGELICVCLYKKGAATLVNLLNKLTGHHTTENDNDK